MNIFSPSSILNITNLSFQKSQRGVSPSFGTSSRSYKNTKETLVQDNLVLTNTWMYRDDVDWEGLVKYMEKNFRNKGRVHIYSIAASDGSEADTIALTIKNTLDKKTAKKFLPIFASDNDDVMVNSAKSGYINLRFKDMSRIREHGIDPKQYYTLSKNKHLVEEDLWVPGMHTYKRGKFLKDAVKYEKCELVEKLKSIQDNSNTIILCRNVTPYLTPTEVLDAALNASKNLKKGSLFVIGKYDSNTDIADYLKNLGFKCVMRNVFQKSV